MQMKMNGVGTGGILINEQNEILLLQRVRPPEANCWSIPGGAIEFGETAEHAIIREFQEETGLLCEVIGFLGYFDYILQTEQTHWVSLFFVMGRLSLQEPKNMEPEKHLRLQWHTWNALPGNLTENTAYAINLYKKWLKKRQQ